MGLLSEILVGSLISRFLLVGVSLEGESSVDETCSGVDIESLGFFVIGVAFFGGLPTPRFCPLATSAVCAILFTWAVPRLHTLYSFSRVDVECLMRWYAVKHRT